MISMLSTWIKEDAPQGDVTTQAIFGKAPHKISARFLAKTPLVLSSLAYCKTELAKCFPELRFTTKKKDGAHVAKHEVFATLTGSLQQILLVERTLLNVLQRMCGIATITSEFVRLSKTKILDTRKTTPGWRDLEKQAVKHGGGTNHRRDLSDQYLIKDNHIAAAGSVTRAILLVKKHRDQHQHKKIGVEVTTLSEFREALPLQPDYILLDNMPFKTMRIIVNERNRFAKIHPHTKPIPELEVSGGVTLKTIRALSRLGVDRISIGALTHSAPAADISLDLGA